MATVICAISGIRFACSHLTSLHLDNTAGFMHPIFAAEYSNLLALYTQHCKGELETTDSYLLFLALLHSTEKVTWKQPASVVPTSISGIQLVENNISQLVQVLAKTAYIRHPRFSQPELTISASTSKLEQVNNWIAAWDENITDFYYGLADSVERDALQKVENKLTKMILGSESPKQYASVIANWAAKAGDFPEQHCKLWRETIRSCFSITKMFNTPLTLLKEIKDHCECNIEVGSIHFHSLMEVLNAGIKRHIDYLGGSSLALGYKLLDPLTTTSEEREQYKREAAGQEKVDQIIASAPKTYPKREDYTTNLDFIRAKLAYRAASSAGLSNKLDAAKHIVDKLSKEGAEL